MKQATYVEPKTVELPKFNKVITIEVNVDDIHKRLMDQFPEDYKHKEILSHAIIGSAIEFGGINHIYNALNGFPTEVDFQVGERIWCSENERRENIYELRYSDDSESDLPKRIYKECVDKEIGECEIIEINVYARDKIKVKFTQDAWRKDSTEEKTAWVNHKNCDKWAEQVH